MWNTLYKRAQFKKIFEKIRSLAKLGRSRLQVYQQGGKLSELSAEFDREPEEEFNYRDKADSEAESTNPTKAWDKVKPRHLSRSLKLCRKKYLKEKIIFVLIRLVLKAHVRGSRAKKNYPMVGPYHILLLYTSEWKWLFPHSKCHKRKSTSTLKWFYHPWTWEKMLFLKIQYLSNFDIWIVKLLCDVYPHIHHILT